MQFVSTGWKVSLLFLGIALQSRAGVPAEEDYEVDTPRPALASRFHIGEWIPDIRFSDLKGATGRISDVTQRRATVIFLHKVGCPLSAKYASTIKAIQKAYPPQAVSFLIVNAGPESADKFQKSLERYEIPGTAIEDPNKTLVRTLGAKVSTDAFILDRTQTLVYRGPIDDQYGIGYALAKPRRNLLRDALDAVLADRRIDQPAWVGPGCSLGLQPLQRSVQEVPTYHRRISRIFQQNCQSCHRPGQNAPFELMEYRDAVDHAPMIARVVRSLRMPPWFSDPLIGHWANDARLSTVDRDDLLRWIKEGTPEGDPQETPLPIRWVDGWNIGTPDHLVKVPTLQQVPAEGVMPYRHVTIATGLNEDKWIQKLEIRPSDPSVVHHVLVFLDYPPGHPDHQSISGAGLKGFFGAYSPGQGHQILPEGMALKLPKEAKLVFQIHYQPNGVATQDQPSLGLVFAKNAPEHEVTVGAAATTSLYIPAGTSNMSFSARYRFQRKTRLLSFYPHMHLRGRTFEIQIVYPDGTKKAVLRVPKYDFRWQLEYQLEYPLDVPEGTELIATGWYDNSENNPANPDPKQNVRFGEQTDDEMLIGYFRSHPL